MTDEQALQIRLLRSQGMGYRAIASVMNLTRDAVRNQCRMAGIGGYRIEYEMNLQERMNAGRACAFCGADLVQPHTGRRRRFCSDICRRNYWRTHRAELKRKESSIYTMECPCCHEIFEVYGNKNRKYCCHEHYVLDRFGPKDSKAVPETGAAFLVPEKEQENGIQEDQNHGFGAGRVQPQEGTEAW